MSTPTGREPWHGWDPDPLEVEPEPVRRSTPSEPAPTWVTWIGLGICIGIVLFALIFTIGRQLDLSAPSSGQTTEPVDLSGPSSAALSGAPHDPGPTVVRGSPVAGIGGAPTPSELAGPRYSAQATYCAPTVIDGVPFCTSWGGDTRFGAVNSFIAGDRPYWVRVWRGELNVDVLVVSYCACQHRDDRIDLSPAAFAELAPLSRGRIDVEVELLPPGHPGPPPATDVDDQHPQDPPQHPDDARMRLEVRD